VPPRGRLRDVRALGIDIDDANPPMKIGLFGAQHGRSESTTGQFRKSVDDTIHWRVLRVAERARYIDVSTREVNLKPLEIV
jgi:hypothetical protein